ncbi:PREDICTED: uncharacterized protein LOC108360947 isoform X2 [Rhagoletis zephyria]|uniref:uncharacterized protein LOC108360947 isoform X2 n=1 Tax=Rhagoletis zephyria TaxID=28612 RepID=UPI00081167A2|nr:PREDICTED: uncharacterized protein LOC108360947 isoform X2 [Rhagoletis zephyria]
MDNSSATIANTKKRVRKLQHNWTNQQTEQLIEAVQIREGLWNYLSREYRDRNLREALWDDVAKEIELPRLEVTTKWNSLRCSFRAAFNRMATTKSGQSAKRLSEPSQLDNSLIFLEPTLNSAASTTSNLMDPTDIMYEVEFLETDDLESTPST